MTKIPIVTEGVVDYIWDVVKKKSSSSLEDSPLSQHIVSGNSNVQQLLSLPQTITQSNLWTKTEKARQYITDLMKKIKPCARLPSERALMKQLEEKIKEIEEKLLIDECNCRTITAIFSIKSTEQLSLKLKEIRLKVAKWGEENECEDLAHDIRHKNVLFIHARKIIEKEEPDYSTDSEYEMACINTDKKTQGSKEQSQNSGQRRRGENSSTIAKEETMKDLESLYGATPVFSSKPTRSASNKLNDKKIDRTQRQLSKASAPSNAHDKPNAKNGVKTDQRRKSAKSVCGDRVGKPSICLP